MPGLKERVGSDGLELPARGDLRWLQPVQETAFEDFRLWTEEIAAAGSGKATPEQIARGIELATLRRSEMSDLIAKDPRRALELSVPESVRRTLPQEVTALLEERMSDRGDLAVQATTHTADCGQGECCRITRTATLADGRVFGAHTFGRRSAISTRDNIAIHGVTLDGKLAMSDLPGRLLEPTEVAFLRAAGSLVDTPCEEEDGSEAHGTSPESKVYIAWDSSRASCYCDSYHALQALYLAENEEQTGATVAYAEDLDGVIAYSGWTEGRKTLLMIRVDFPDYQQSVPVATLEQLVEDMDTAYSDMSYGKTTFAPVGQGSAVTPILRLPGKSSDYTSFGTILSAARSAASNAGYILNNYSFDVVLTGAKPFKSGSAGVAWVNAKGAWLHNSQWTLKTCAHEVGHNFGLFHSGAWDTDDGSVIGPGRVSQYGNEFDLMGVGPESAFKRHFGASQKRRMGWLPAEDIVVKSGGSDGYSKTRIRAMDMMQADGNNRALVVDRFGSADDYWVEHRQQFGTKYGMRDGVLVNWANKDDVEEQPLQLDMNPQTYQKNDGVLAMGETFTDADANIHITPVARGQDPDGVWWMDVTLFRNPPSGNREPQASLSASPSAPAVGVEATFTATATDPDGDTLGYFWEWGDGTTTANNSPSAKKTWSSSGVKTVRCIVTDMKGKTTTAQLLIQVGSTSTHFIQGRVLTPLGDPVQGVVVRATSSHRDTTDSAGFYAITGLEPGTYTLTASLSGSTVQPGNFTNPLTVGPSRQNINFVETGGSPKFTADMGRCVINQGTSSGAIPIPLADSDTPLSDLSLSGSSFATSVIPNGNIVFGTLASGVRTVSVSAGGSVSGILEITITATDPSGNSASLVWPVTVNGKPTVSPGTLSVAENTPLDIDLRPYVSDSLTPDELIAYIPDRVRNGTVAMLPDGYTARFTPSPGFNGNAYFRLTARNQSISPNFLFFYDFEPPDSDEDGSVSDRSNFSRTGNLDSTGGGIYAFGDSVPPAIAPQSTKSLTLVQTEANSGGRLSRMITPEDHDINNADWTFSAWINRASNNTQDQILHLGEGDGFGGHNELILLFNANNNALRVQKWAAAGGLAAQITGPNLAPGTWHHVTLSYDRTSANTGDLYLYVDGFPAGSVSSVTMDLSQSVPVNVGAHANPDFAQDRWFDGEMDEVLFQRGLAPRREVLNLSKMGARHHHGLFASAQMQISVTGADQPPSISPIPDQILPPDTTTQIPVLLSDAETENRNLMFTAVSSNTGLLPASGISITAAQPWVSTDVGAVGSAGITNEDHGTFLITSAAPDIGPASGDAFRWVRQNFSGDSEMVARVLSVDHTTFDSKAGIMMRESASATSPFAYVCVTPSDGVRFLSRSAGSTAATVHASIPAIAAPCWVKLVRTGNSYTAFHAPDDSGAPGAWQAVGTAQTLVFSGATHEIGLAVTSKVSASSTTAVFDNLGGTVQLGGKRVLSLTPAAGRSGSSAITVTAGDGSNTTNLTFNVTVNDAGFLSWQSMNGASGTMDGDHDGDGVQDGIEYFLTGPNGSSTGMTTLPGVEENEGTLSISWTMGPGYNGTYGVNYVVETSTTLTGAWTRENPDPNLTIVDGTVTYVFPSPSGTARFARLSVGSP